MTQFQEWPKIARLNRDICITEKIDGTNAAVGVVRAEVTGMSPMLAFAAPVSGVLPGGQPGETTTFYVYAQSRTRIITPQDDNYGFARWVQKNAALLLETLGEGLHFGEWWGVGIGRSYDLSERRFSLFNVRKWNDTTRPNWVASRVNPDVLDNVPSPAERLARAREDGVAIYTVPVLYEGPWTGCFGYKDAATGEWLHMPEQQDWAAADEAKETERRILSILNEVEDPDAAEPMLRQLVPVNPRPRFAPNFILEWLKRVGSQAAPGYSRPEGVVVFHKASQAMFKATIEKDEEWKGKSTGQRPTP